MMDRCAFCGRRRQRAADLPEGLRPHRFVGASDTAICESCIITAYGSLTEKYSDVSDSPQRAKTDAESLAYAKGFLAGAAQARNIMRQHLDAFNRT